MSATLILPKIETKVIAVKDIQVLKDDEGYAKNQRPILVDGEKILTQSRFWTSMYSRFAISDQFFNYFSHDEVFDRIHEKHNGDKLRICIERAEDSGPKMLAVSAPSKPVADIQEVYDLLQQYDGERISYHNGEISALHTPSIGGSHSIGGDLFHNKFSAHVPIDGYGLTSLYLAMIRQVCSNGAIAISRAFKSTLQLGKKDDSVLPTLMRALDSYNNDEGFHALRSRIESSTQSWASVYEASNLYKQLIKMHLADELVLDAPSFDNSMVKRLAAESAKSDRYYESERLNEYTPVLSAFHRLTGDTSMIYGIANPDEMSPKRQTNLPVKCTMYDLVNFATEVSTHYSNSGGQRRLQGWFGTQISNEFDLEGTVKEFPDFNDFYIDRRFSTGLTGSLLSDNAHLDN